MSPTRRRKNVKETMERRVEWRAKQSLMDIYITRGCPVSSSSATKNNNRSMAPTKQQQEDPDQEIEMDLKEEEPDLDPELIEGMDDEEGREWMYKRVQEYWKERDQAKNLYYSSMQKYRLSMKKGVNDKVVCSVVEAGSKSQRGWYRDR